MDKLFVLSLKHKAFIFLNLATLLIYYFVMGSISNATSDIFSVNEWLMKSNYISITITSIYVYWAYCRTSLYKSTYYNITVRLGKNRVLRHMVKISIWSMVYMLFICYILPMIIFFNHITDMNLFFVFLFFRVILSFMEECIYIGIYFDEKNKYNILHLLPIVMNVVFYFFYVLVVF